MARSTDHLEAVVIQPHTLRRWSELAGQLGEWGQPLRTELADLAGDCTRHRLTRCARAARGVEKQLAGDLALIANAAATEIEVAAS